MPTYNELYEESKCFLCYGLSEAQALKLALLVIQARAADPEADLSPQALLAGSACFVTCALGNLFDLFELQLLSIISSNPCTPGNVDGLIWGPNPETVDSISGNTDSVLAFLFTLTNGSNYTTLSFGNPVHTVGSVEFASSTLMTSLTFRLLETVGGDLAVGGSAVLTSFSAPLLQSVTGDLNFDSSAALLNLTLPSLTSAPATILVSGGAIETLSLPVMASYPVFGITADGSLLTLNLPACVDDGAGQLNTDLALMTGLVTLNLNALTAVTASFDVSGSGNLASLNLVSLGTVGADIVLTNTSLVSIALPALTSVTGNAVFATIAPLASFSAPLLASIGGGIDYNGNNTLTSISLPSLVTVTLDFIGNGCVTMTSFSAPLWVPTDGTTIDLGGCALDAPSVEGILRRLVLAGVVACTINLSGGTNAGTASLSAQGQADVATLGAQLTMNP